MKILIADNFVIVRRGIRQILADEFPSASIEESGDFTDLLLKAKSTDWDIIISDFTMPGGGGLSAIREISSFKPASPILVLSFNDEGQYAAPVINAGASGFLNKASTANELLQTVKIILAGNKILPNNPVTQIVPTA